MRDYRILKGTSREDLEAQVNAKLAEGYEVTGGFTMSYDPPVMTPGGRVSQTHMYYQAVVAQDIVATTEEKVEYNNAVVEESPEPEVVVNEA